MDMSEFRGAAVALVTPFDEGGEVDREALARHVEWQIESGIDVLVPCGTTGENATMSAAEQREVIALTVEVADGRVPVMAGAGGNRTDEVVSRAQAVQDVGADAILSVAPYYNKPTQAGLYAHFSVIARSVELPIFVYNVPGRTSSNVQPETLLRLAEIENIVGVKEASGDLDQVMDIIEGRPANFLVLSGEDSLTLPMIAVGGDGVVSVVANEAPAEMAELVAAALDGDMVRARELHYRLLPVMRANFVETNPIPVKAALEMMGRLTAVYRLPLVALSTDEHVETVRSALKGAGLL